VRQQAFRCALAAAALLVLAATASAQTGGQAEPGGAVPKPPAQGAAKDAKAAAEKPAAKVAGTFGQWTLVCGEANGKTEAPLCSLVQSLIEKESKQLVFRVALAYGPKGNLVLRIDGPTGVALQKGLEFSPDAVKIYRLPFQTCLPRGCTAVLLVEDDLKQDLQKSPNGTITVYALDGQAVRAVAALAGLAEGLAALDKRRTKP
jgi:invasion protein IalB